MMKNFDEVGFWRLLGEALKDPEFREAFIEQLREMIDNDKNGI